MTTLEVNKSKDALPILVIGPGLIGKQHIRLINDNPRTRLAAIVAPDHVCNHEVATELGVPIYQDLRTCLAVESLAGVIIASPNEFHASQARECILAGIPLLIEKPITVTSREGIELVELAVRHQAKVMVGHHRAHSPLMTDARKAIAEGTIGRIVTVMGSAQFYKPAEYFEAGPWRRELGGGPVLINLIHEIGNLRSLCGEINSVQAMSSSAIRQFSVEDTVVINFSFVSGALGTFVLSDTAASTASWEQTSGENPAYPPHLNENCYVISGTRGCISIPTMRVKFAPDGEEPSWWKPLSERTLNTRREDPLAKQLEHFVDVIENNCPPLVSARDGVRNLEITEAVQTAAITGMVVKV